LRSSQIFENRTSKKESLRRIKQEQVGKDKIELPEKSKKKTNRQEEHVIRSRKKRAISAIAI